MNFINETFPSVEYTMKMRDHFINCKPDYYRKGEFSDKEMFSAGVYMLYHRCYMGYMIDGRLDFSPYKAMLDMIGSICFNTREDRARFKELTVGVRKAACSRFNRHKKSGKLKIIKAEYDLREALVTYRSKQEKAKKKTIWYKISNFIKNIYERFSR